VDERELAFAGAARQAELVRSGQVSPRELVDMYLDRIERLDPQLNAFRVVWAERARAEADQATARARAGDDRPLLGVPVAIKDDVGIAGEVMTFGSNACGPAPEQQDWEIVRRLRAAGAVIVGITNVPELTIFPFTETATHGITRNPWDRQRTPGGSSGGSGAAVASGMVPLATASDGGGSIRIPAAFCGLVGLKPQRGRIPYKPVGEGWHGLSSVGVLTRDVADAALVHDALTPLACREAIAREPGTLRIAVSFAVPKGLLAKVDPEIRRATEEVAETLRSLGHEVVERDPDYGLAALNWGARYFRGIHDDAKAMADPSRLEPRTKGMARIGQLIGRRGLDRALAALDDDIARVNAIFDDVDLILGPGTAQVAPPAGKWTAAGALRTFNGVGRVVPFNAVWNHTGNPAASIPSGIHSTGLPMAVQLVAPFEGEETILAVAAQVERARPWAERRPPIAP
jgi:amidase